jgi:beta-xylosidase/AraC-like DNA-binding protein
MSVFYLLPSIAREENGMERNYLKPDALMELDFVTDKAIGVHWHENLELLVVVSGQLRLTVEDDSYELKSGDLVLVNVSQKHGYQGSNELVLGRFLISYSKVRDLLSLNHVLFWCNSVADRNEEYDALRRVISQIFNQTMGSDGRSKLFLNSLYFQLLYILAENFTLTPNDKRYEETGSDTNDHMQEIFSYVRSNYWKNISLNDIAHQLYLSPTYVSKYIKKKCGINFIQLLNSVRLSHAMEDLMYSDESIMKIALENGFASVAAYNKAFKDTYHQTPSAFRKEHKSGKEIEPAKKKRMQALVQQRVEEYLERTPSGDVEKAEQVSLTAEVDMSAPSETEWKRSPLRMVNIGTAADILNASIQQKLLESQEALDFEYVRFWDIYDTEMYLDIHSPDGQQNYSRLNAVTDFLVQHHLKPYIELGFKARRIIRTTTMVVRNQMREDFFADEDEMERFYRALFWHFIKRYGSWEVRSWYFEYWESPIQDESGVLQYAQMADQHHRAYFRQFSIIAKALRSQLPEAKIGGAGFPVRIYGETAFSRLLGLWKQEKQLPDFLTLSCYPYQQEKRSSDLKFVRYGIELAKKATEVADFPAIPLHVTEYNLTLSSRNLLNDSCLKAAYLISNTIDCMNQAEILGHYLFSDFYTEAKDTDELLFGGNGYFSKDGIPKPSFYAMEFLHMLYPTVQKRHKNYMITRNSRGSLRLVCHNLKKPNFNYYLSEEDALEIQELPSMLTDREFLTLKIKVFGMPDGVYVVKTNLLNSHHGSIQDKWMDMNMESNLTRKEMEYLRMSSHSDIFARKCESQNGCLDLEWEMEPNEIRYVHIYRKE